MNKVGLSLLILAPIFFVIACSKNIYRAKPDCFIYYDFMQKNWELTNTDSLVYGFKGNPKYWEEDIIKYFDRKCFIGLTREQVEKLLGKPSKSFVFFDLHIAFYCMSKDCLKAMKNVSRELVINYDAKGIVIEAYINPFGVDVG